MMVIWIRRLHLHNDDTTHLVDTSASHSTGSVPTTRGHVQPTSPAITSNQRRLPRLRQSSALTAWLPSSQTKVMAVAATVWPIPNQYSECFSNAPPIIVIEPHRAGRADLVSKKRSRALASPPRLPVRTCRPKRALCSVAKFIDDCFG
jgi:hypothetical protein